jgi:homoserine O-acetyltransferase
MTSPAWHRERAFEVMGFPNLSDYMLEIVKPLYQYWDPDDLLVLARQWQVGDISNINGEPYEVTLGRITAHVLILSSSTDQFFPWEDNEYECSHLTWPVMEIIVTKWGTWLVQVSTW